MIVSFHLTWYNTISSLSNGEVKKTYSHLYNGMNSYHYNLTLIRISLMVISVKNKEKHTI